MSFSASDKALINSLLVSTLGYFVDVYDLLLFSVVRSKSLRELDIPEEALLESGLSLLNWMLIGMMAGGVVWGILGDKKGRRSVLFGSILIYSLANFLNAYVTDVGTYKILRLVAGFGLAGELGAGITLVCELMKPDRRAYGTLLITAIGLLGAVFAAYIGQYYDWRFAYKLGGMMGFALLLLRIGSRESTIFEKSQDLNISHGNFLQLITRKDLLLRYLKLILLGLPIFFVIGILVTATPEFARAFGMNEIPETGFAIMISYTFISLGDILCTFLSQLLKSRKKALAIFLWISLAGILVFLLFPGQTPLAYYWHCAIMGIGIGYLSLLVTFVSERFGTNLRATATISAPNFIRGLLPVFIAPIFLYIKSQSDLITAGVVMGILCTIIPMILLLWIKEDYGKSMDWVE
ncbi:MAG: MFS transporter [Saprospiraceae bacterium]|nr:MFS transporter [Saprospiraceae bacterium]MCC6844594.1 MFS transporter [Saprospiraceae bacterium]HRG33871.1 MFS transporter [Saprospiraceae bacterium]